MWLKKKKKGRERGREGGEREKREREGGGGGIEPLLSVLRGWVCYLMSAARPSPGISAATFSFPFGYLTNTPQQTYCHCLRHGLEATPPQPVHAAVPDKNVRAGQGVRHSPAVYLNPGGPDWAWLSLQPSHSLSLDMGNQQWSTCPFMMRSGFFFCSAFR